MGHKLYKENDVFRESILKCDEVFKKLTKKWSIKEEFESTTDKNYDFTTEIAQPANLALQIALTELIKSHNIFPDAVVGHSTGELTAIFESGIYSLEQAFKVAYIRGLHQVKLAGKGGLLALNISVPEAIHLINKYPDSISLAAVNSNTSVTLAGSITELKKIHQKFLTHAYPKFLQVDIPYHSRLMDDIKHDFYYNRKKLNPDDTYIPSGF